jgi:YD repeat-containing protein
VAAITVTTAQAQQGGTTQYVYDDNGRLTAVISPSGEAAVYEYDAAGNFTAIRRVTADQFQIFSFSPSRGSVGDSVTVIGVGFDGVSVAALNGTAATITAVTTSAVTITVPEGATTGPITLSGPRGAASSANSFAVVPKVQVSPGFVTLNPSEATTFVAIVGGGMDPSVTWSVNGVTGGNASVGTISTAGGYIAPATLTGNSSLTVTIRATSVAQPDLFGEATVRVINPESLGEFRAAALSVSRGLSSPIISASISVTRNPNPGFNLSSAAVSVQRGSMGTISNVISLSYGANGTTYSAPVSVTSAPVIDAITSSTINRGTSQTVTFTGRNLVGVSAIRFIDSGGNGDPGVSAASVTPSPDGTSVTAVITVTSPSPGKRVVYVVSPAGRSQTVDVGTNTITVN